jgi:hypothetical protein
MTKKFYRYSDMHNNSGAHIELSEFVLLRETPCGYWITSNWYERLPKPWPPGIERSAERSKKWISKTSRKKYAYETKQEALKSFKHRKERQINLANFFRFRAIEALGALERYKIDGI